MPGPHEQRFKRSLLHQVMLQGTVRAWEARTGKKSPCTLANYPACLAAVRASVATIRRRKTWRGTMRVLYRGVTLHCSVTGFDRLLVRLPDGRPVGSSGYGAMERD